jgi:hypothetical protein
MFARFHMTPLQISAIRNLTSIIHYSNAICKIVFEFIKTMENLFPYPLMNVIGQVLHKCQAHTHTYTYIQVSTYITTIHREAYISHF